MSNQDQKYEKSLYLKTLDVVFDFALVEFIYEIFLLRTFKSLFECVKHHSTELLDIVLLKGCRQK